MLWETLDELGEDRHAWSMRATADGEMWGQVLPDRTVQLSTSIPCEWLADYARHEYMHVLQIRAHGDWQAVIEHYGSEARAELIADCGSALLGSTSALPYIDPSSAHHIGECSERDTLEARSLIDRQGTGQ